MSYDYWTTMRQYEWPAIDTKITEFAGRRSERAYWIGQELTPLLAKDAEDLAYYRAFERAALAFHYYDALGEDAREDVRTGYSTKLIDEYRIPDAVIRLKTALSLEPTHLALDYFPKFSTTWQIQFNLATDYLSKDDVTLYPIDNPVRKEHVLKLPMVASTGWKGSLRSAFRQQHGVGDEDDTLVHLFGQIRADEEGQAGCLYFLPTYFTKLGLIVINPHNRETGVSERGPILFETVPRNSQGCFTLLYVPRGQVTAPEVAKDISKTAQALQAMFLIYGFGAKTSSGFGTAEEQCQGSLRIKMVDPTPITQPNQPATKPDEPAILHAFWQKYPGEDFTLKPKAWREQHRATNAEKDKYVAAKEAYGIYQAELAAYEAAAAGQGDIPAEPASILTERTFSSFSEMVQKVEELAAVLGQEGEVV